MAKRKTGKGAAAKGGGAAKGGVDTKAPANKQEAEAEERRPTIEDRFAELSARYKWYVFVPILIGLAAVVVLVIHSEQRRRQARNALGAFEAAHTVADFDAVATQYPHRSPGRMALVRAGELLYEQGSYAEARQHYQDYLRTDPDPELAMPVWMAIVQTYIAEGDYARAISTCDAALGQEGREYVKSQAGYYKGYCLEMSGDTEQAMVEYGKVTEPGGQEQPGAWYQPAATRLADLQRKARAAEEAAGGDGSSDDSLPEIPGGGLEITDG